MPVFNARAFCMDGQCNITQGIKLLHQNADDIHMYMILELTETQHKPVEIVRQQIKPDLTGYILKKKTYVFNLF